MLTIHVDTRESCTTRRLFIRSRRGDFSSALARLLDLYDPFQHAGNLAPLASW